MAKPPSFAPYSRAVNVALAMVIGVAVVGYIVGIRPAQVPSTESAPAASASGAIPGQTYLDWRQRRHGPNAVVRSDLGELRGALPALSAPVERTPELQAKAKEIRANLRAYDGAPPTIPHPIDEQSAGSCLACHRDGMVVEGRVARAISHPPYTHCTQCHVTTEPRFDKPPAPDNDFVGYRLDRKREQAWQGAPPVIPHTVWMRDRCESCHGVAGLPGVRTTHPERGQCTQCHVPRKESSPPWAAAVEPTGF
jgi:cytochrome c-type protein NapB